MSIIPNVSSVYRDLSHISSTAGSLISKHNQPGYYSLSPAQPSQVSSFEDLYTHKQQRHNQLMRRLHSSKQEHDTLLGRDGQQTTGTGYGSGVRDRTWQGGHQVQQSGYGTGGYNSIRTNEGAQRGGSRFVMPKLKYRHIQEAGKGNNDLVMGRQAEMSNTVPEKKQLEREFYEDLEHSRAGKQIVNQNARNQSNAGIGTQAQLRQLEDDERSQISNKTSGFNKSSSNVKYSENLESYYELCKKNVVPKKQQPVTQKQQKFTRGPSTKNKALKLDQAIKLLSLQ